ncbi:DUF4276 family protein [Desulfovibrio sp. TomC]|uniref:DUF4276 family protein n=1 Tax=Desulfovibrio sp. TomC TaxID=1562888 RepID=UPI0009E5090F|nr:DUF4276 family protein [Desulfovibrio sp. TomC]
MRELVFLLEEESAKGMLEGLLPRIVPPGIVCRCIPFEGKQDLKRQLVRKIKYYQNRDAFFVVMRDRDSHPDCIALKAEFKSLCSEAGKPDALIRIACCELESFYLADLQAVEKGLGLTGLVRLQGKAKFRAPDTILSPSKELDVLTGGRYQKVGGSRAIGLLLDPENTRSTSFKHLVSGIRRVVDFLS